MSGICGILSATHPELASPEVLAAMVDAIGHRGGTACRSYFDAAAGFALGQVHTSTFTPAGETGATLWHDDGGHVAALDGAIFNAADLLPEQARPQAAGRAASAAVACLRRGPASFPQRLDGHFALALWDRSARELWLVRDALGTKPLYWCRVADRDLVVFASEPKAILAHPAVGRRLDREALSAFLTFGYVPAPLCIFEGVHKVFPGEVLRCGAGVPVVRRQYWTVPPFVPRVRDVAVFATELRERLLHIVAKQLQGVARVGMYFSGGLESTVLAAILRLLGIADIHTFTVGFRTDGARAAQCEDVHWAEQIARAFGTRQQSIVLGADHDPRQLLPRVVRQFDEPMVTPNCYSKYLLSRAAHAAGIDSCVSGSNAEGSLERARGKTIRKMTAALGLHASDEERILFAQRNVFSFAEQAALLTEPIAEPREVALQIVRRYRQGIVADDVGDLIDGTLLRMSGAEKSVAVQDRTAVLNQVEVRHPFYDRELVEYASTIPASLKGGESDGMRRAVLVDAFRDVLPASVATRTKVGFPSYYWNRGELGELQQRLLAPSALTRAGLLRVDTVQAIVAADRTSDDKSAGKRTWALLMLQAWFESYFGDDKAGAAPDWSRRLLRPRRRSATS